MGRLILLEHGGRLLTENGTDLLVQERPGDKQGGRPVLNVDRSFLIRDEEILIAMGVL